GAPGDDLGGACRVEAVEEGECRAAAGERDSEGCVGVFRCGTRPPHDEMIAFIDTMKHRFGVEAVCRVLGATESGFITARGYRAAKSRPPSARRLSDELLGAEIARLHEANYGVYGVRKMHHVMLRQGWALGRDQTGRIMRDLGLAGVRQ